MFLFIDARPLTNSYATMDLDELYVGTNSLR